MFLPTSILLIFLCYCQTAIYASEPQPILQQCAPEKITIPQCKDTFYNFTSMPNGMGQSSQVEVYHQLQSFEPLVKSQCSGKLQFMLCSVYAPMCDPVSHLTIGPCRSLCLHVRLQCEPILQAFKVAWPSDLECSRFPLKDETSSNVCMEVENAPEVTSEGGDQSADSTAKNLIEPLIQSEEKLNKSALFKLLKHRVDRISNIDLYASNLPTDTWPCRRLVGIDTKNRVYNKRTGMCDVRCNNLMRNSSIGIVPASHINTMTWILLILSIFVSLSCLATLLCDLLRSTNCYPLRYFRSSSSHQSSLNWASVRPPTSRSPVYARWDWLDPQLANHPSIRNYSRHQVCIVKWITLCQLTLALAHFLRYALGYKQLVCNQQEMTVVHNGMESPLCILSFLLTSFATTATWFWCLAWTVSVVIEAQYQVGWCNKKSNRLSTFSNKAIVANQPPHHHRSMVWRHVMAWTPAGLVIAGAFVLRAVEPNLLTGMCEVGYYRSYLLADSRPNYQQEAMTSNSTNTNGTDLRRVLIQALSVGPPILAAISSLVVTLIGIVLLACQAVKNQKNVCHHPTLPIMIKKSPDCDNKSEQQLLGYNPLLLVTTGHQGNWDSDSPPPSNASSVSRIGEVVASRSPAALLLPPLATAWLASWAPLGWMGARLYKNANWNGWLTKSSSSSHDLLLTDQLIESVATFWPSLILLGWRLRQCWLNARARQDHRHIGGGGARCYSHNHQRSIQV